MVSYRIQDGKDHILDENRSVARTQMVAYHARELVVAHAEDRILHQSDGALQEVECRVLGNDQGRLRQV